MNLVCGDFKYIHKTICYFINIFKENIFNSYKYFENEKTN